MEIIKYLWDTTDNTWYRPSTTLSGDLTIAKKTNGKLICVMSDKGVFREGECLDVNTLVSHDDSVINWVTIPITTNGGYCAVSRIGGELFLCVTDKGVSGTRDASTKLYKSLSGNGGDWQYYSTISSLNTTGLYLSMNSNALNGTGCITVLSNGRWVIPVGIFKNYSGYMIQKFWVCTSDDLGFTWIKRFEMNAYISTRDYYEQGCPKHVAVTGNGDLYIAFAANEGGMYIKFYRSLDNGNTWTQTWYESTNSWEGVNAVDFELISNSVGGLYLYCNASSGLATRIYEISDPINAPSIKTIVKDFSLSTTGYTNPTMQIIDNKLIITKQNYLLGVNVTANGNRGAMYYKSSDGLWKRVFRCR